MKPILFDASATSWNTNGLGRIDVASCTVTEELNGIFELQMSCPTSTPLLSQLVVSNIVLAQPYDGATPQPFRIYKVEKGMSGLVEVYARHLSYQLNWIPVMPFNYSSLSDCLTKLKTYSVYTNPFTFETNKTITTGGAFTEPLPCRSCLGGVQGSVLQRYGGDYVWDGYKVKLLTRRGADNGVRISYGKNLINADQETNIENTYTGVCPYVIDSDTDDVITLPEKYILASTAPDFPFLRVQTVDFSSDFDGKPTVAELRARTQRYITENNIGHPSVSIDVSFIALWQTEDYANIAPLERVQLGDTVTVHFDKLGLDEQARVVAYEYDVIRERYNKVTIGDAKSSFAKTFVDQGHLIEEVVATIPAEVAKGTSWLTRGNGYVVAIKNTDGSWKELVFLDTPSIQTARKVLRINENGIGFSSTGYYGNYAQSWTLDGVLSLGGTNNAYGNLVLLNNDGKKIVELDKAGLSLYNNNGKIIASLYENGAFFDEYNRSGQLTYSSFVSGTGLWAASENGNEAVVVEPGMIDVTDDDGTSTGITGSDVSTRNVSYRTLNGYECFNGTYTTVDGTVLTIYRGAVIDVQAGSGADFATQEDLEAVIEAVNDLYDMIDGGGGGWSGTIEIDPERWVDIEVDDGVITDVDQGPY